MLAQEGYTGSNGVCRQALVLDQFAFCSCFYPGPWDHRTQGESVGLDLGPGATSRRVERGSGPCGWCVQQAMREFVEEDGKLLRDRQPHIDCDMIAISRSKIEPLGRKRHLNNRHPEAAAERQQVSRVKRPLIPPDAQSLGLCNDRPHM